MLCGALGKRRLSSSPRRNFWICRRVRRSPPRLEPIATSPSPEAHMTRRTNARVAGFAFLFYIALGIAAMVLAGKTGSAEGIAAQLAGFAQHAPTVRVAAIINLLTG